MPAADPAFCSKGDIPLDNVFPLSIPISTLDRKHHEYESCAQTWRDAYLLYAGGAEMEQEAARFLPAKPAEDARIYAARLAQFVYENNFGTGIGYYESFVFRDDPLVSISPELVSEQQTFYSDFQSNADGSGRSFVDVFRALFRDLLLYRTAFALLDLPPRDGTLGPQTLEEERTSGRVRPRLFSVAPTQVINWGIEDGRLSWAVVHSAQYSNHLLGTTDSKLLRRWTIYTATDFATYEEAPVVAGSAQSASLVHSGRHALAKYNIVPLQRIDIPAGWWIGNRAQPTAKAHIRLSNVHDFSLFMGALAVPVVITDADVNSLTHSETGFVKLPSDSKYEFAEPRGVAWQHLADRVQTLRHEIFRSMYLISQARDTSATAAAQSGVSKEQDAAPSCDFANGLGDVLRAAQQETLRRVALIRAATGFPGDAKLRFTVSGYVFEEGVAESEVATAQALLDAGVPSETFRKSVYKRLVASGMRDVIPAERDKALAEIDAAPSEAEQRASRSADISAKFLASLRNNSSHE